MNSQAASQRDHSKVICAFYASTCYGSEYRAGMEFIKFAASCGFTLALTSDVEKNSTAEEIESNAPGIRVIRIPSAVKRQSTLFRINDFLPQSLWHYRAARWLRANNPETQNLWVQNGASPWLPISPYLGLSKTLIWGPTGGGEPPSPAMMAALPWRHQLRENLRSQIELFLLNRKKTALRNSQSSRLIPMARTREAQEQLRRMLGRNIPIIPEIIDPIKSVQISKEPATYPRFIWAGQDVPRKNLPLALKIFQHVRQSGYPDATIDIYGCTETAKELPDGATCHGWVNRVPWENYRNNGVLLLTSFREGLPSVLLEAASNGLLCISSDVGAISLLDIPTLHILPKTEYPNFEANTLDGIVQSIRSHLARDEIRFKNVSHRQQLTDHLLSQGVFNPL